MQRRLLDAVGFLVERTAYSMSLLGTTLLSLIVAGFICVLPGCAVTPATIGEAASPADTGAASCISPIQVERMNGMSKRDRVAHIKGETALFFILLDPAWSRSESGFESFQQQLLQHGIDEVIIWDLPNWTLNAAVPFTDGCAIEGYGSPDWPDKLDEMQKIASQLSEYGLDHPALTQAIADLLPQEHVEPLLEKIRPFVERTDKK